MMGRVALVQMVSGTELELNLQQTKKLLLQAAETGADLVVLPENFALLDSVSLRGLADQELDQVVQFLCQQATNLGIWVVAGSLPMAVDEHGNDVRAPQVRSVSLVIDALGAIRGRYDKIHLFDVEVADAQSRYRESAFVEAGTNLAVVDTPVGRLGLTVCYDLRFPEQFMRLREMGAELISVPSAFTQVTGEAHWEVLLRARAIETQCYLLGANQGGCHSPERETWGQSMVVDPWGVILDEAEKGEAVISAPIDLDRLREIRERMPVLAHRQRAGF